MTLPVTGGDGTGPAGYTYAAVAVRAGTPGSTHQELLAILRELRFSGWLAPQHDGWLVAVAAGGDGVTAAGRRCAVGVGQELAARTPATVLAVQVVRDRRLLLAAWSDGDELGRYVSDPSYGVGADVLPDPLGVEHADAFARAAGRPGAADELGELLAEELDPDDVIESERLAGVCRLLGLPRWLVSVASLPRDVPAGPRARELTRLGAGVPGVPGLVAGRAAGLVRRRLRPPPVVPDPPRSAPGADPWLY